MEMGGGTGCWEGERGIGEEDWGLEGWGEEGLVCEDWSVGCCFGILSRTPGFSTVEASSISVWIPRTYSILTFKDIERYGGGTLILYGTGTRRHQLG